MKKRLCALFLAAAMCVAAGAASSSSVLANSSKASDPVTINVWHLWGENLEPTHVSQRVLQWAEDFNDEHDHIKVEVLSSQTMDTTLAAIAGNDGPDVFMNQWPMAPTWFNNGAIIELTDYVNNDEDFDKDDIIPAAWQISTTKDGKILSIPFAMNGTLLYYNKDILEEAGYTKPPRTMERLIEMAKALTIPEGNNYSQVGFIPNYPWLDNVLWPVVYGAEWYDADGNVDFNNSRMIESYQWQADLIDFYGYEKLLQWRDGFSTGLDPFKAGKLAFLFRADSYGAGIAMDVPDLNYGVINMPYPEDYPELAGSNFITGNVFCISAKSKNQDEAWTVLSSLAGKKAMSNFVVGEMERGNLYSRASALNTMEDIDSILTPMKESAKWVQGDNVKAFPMSLYVNQYLTAINDEMSLAVDGKKPVEEAVAAVQKAVEELQAEYDN